MRVILSIIILTLTAFNCNADPLWPYGQPDYNGICNCYLSGEYSPKPQKYPQDFDCFDQNDGTCVCSFDNDDNTYALSLSRICKVLDGEGLRVSSDGSGRLTGEEVHGNMQGMREMCAREPDSKLCQGEQK